MRFTESEISMAARLRGAGLQWDPQPGHYIFDIDGVMKAGSPFQSSVYLISSPNQTAIAAGGHEALASGFSWLPTWEDARAWLMSHGVTPKQLAATLEHGMEEGLSDRESLYTLIIEHLEQDSQEGP
jgi:hypothetical protein